MIAFLSQSIADLYIKRNIIKPDEKEVYKCGLELILNDIVTFSLIIAYSTKWLISQLSRKRLQCH